MKIFDQNKSWPSIILITSLGLIVYSNTFFCSFQFDDLHYIVENSFITSFQNLLTHWQFYPCRFITFLSIVLNYHFNGLNVFGYHVFNLAIHLASAILVWWLAILTLSTPAMKEDKISEHAHLMALLIGLVFVSHPLQTESVTYIWQRTTSMAAMFYLASLCLYIKARLFIYRQGACLLPSEQTADHKDRPYYIASLIMAVMAMFTKENTVTLPLMILLYEFSFFKFKRISNLKYLFPFLLTLFIIPLTILFTKAPQFQSIQKFIHTPGGTSPFHYLLTQFKVFLTYIRLLFLPLNQNIDYNYPVSKSIFEIPTLSGFLFLAGILFWAKQLFAKHRLLSFSILWFFLTLSLESSLFPLKNIIFEHRLYLPLVGYSIFLVSGLYYFFGRNAPKTTIIVLSIIITFNSILTYQRNKVWKDEITLWSDALHQSPHNLRSNYNLGLAYYKLRNLTQSILNFKKAIDIDPNFADAHYNLGLSYFKSGLLTPSTLEYNKTIEIAPTFVKAYINRGNNYAMQGDFTKALSDYNNAVEINPNIPEGYYSRGNAYVSKNNPTQALLEYSKAIEINPDYAGAYLNRGNTYLMQGNATQALSDYSKTIELRPSFTQAYNNRAFVYYLLKEYDMALDDMRQVEELGGKVNPNLINVFKNKSGQDR